MNPLQSNLKREFQEFNSFLISHTTMLKDKSLRYLIYVDILGFEELAKEGAKKTKLIKPEEIRKNFTERVQNKINSLKLANVIERGKKESPDSWLLFTDEFAKVYVAIHEILRAELSFEIAVGKGEFEKHPTEDNLISLRDETIDYLKSNIIGKYHKFYKNKFKKPIKETFILLTKDVFDELDSFEKKYCEEIPYDGMRFYNLSKSVIEEKIKIFDFLKKVGLEEKRYQKIEDLYVPPKNFNKIAEKLRKEKIIFLIGDAEIGKTYTAVKLLLDYYNEGYNPVYYKEREPEKQFEAMSDKLDNVIKNRTAMYFEDPWGKTKFKSPEHIFRDIDNLIDKVSNVDARVIITSREEIFKKFEKKKETAGDLWQHVERLKINTAYSKEDLKEMLKRYLVIFEPKWCRNKKLKQMVINAIKNGTLKTPMSIKELVYFREAKNSDDEKILRQAIKKASDETKIAFGKEITAMFEAGEYEKIVFLSFPYILSDYFYFGINFIEKNYIKFLEFLNKKYNFDLIKAKSFNDVLEWFKNEEIEVDTFGSRNYLKFSHPSYSDGFSYALDNQELCNKIFCNVLKNLVGEDSATPYVAQAVRDNFEKLPEDVRNLLLFKLAEKDSSAPYVPCAASYVVWSVTDNFEKLPKDVRNLLFKLAEKDSTASYVAHAVTDNFEKLPKDVRNLLFKLAEKDSAALGIAWAVTENFEKLPKDVRNLLFKVVEKDAAASDVAWAVTENFEKLPKDVRNLLFFKLAEKDSAASYVAHVVAENFEKLPKDVRNLLFKLAEKDSAASSIVCAIVNNFEKFPEDVRNLLFKLAEKDSTASDVAYIVRYKFEKLPEDVRNLLLFKLAEKDSATFDVVWTVTENFEKLPEDVRNLLFKLAEKDSTTASDVASAISYNFEKLPKDVRNLLLKLNEKDSAA